MPDDETTDEPLPDDGTTASTGETTDAGPATDTTGTDASGEWPVRELTDAGVMRALAHPLRMRLVELLTVGGPLTATECGQRLGETAANCSFHLRTLARYGFVEEAEGGTGRRRPWRAVVQGNRFPAGPSAPPHVRDAADLLTRAFVDRAVGKVYEYLGRMDEYGTAWSDSAVVSDYLSYLTPDEVRDINERLDAVLRPYLHRLRDPSLRPQGARPVVFFVAGVPTDSGTADA